MKESRARQILQALVQGVDPRSGEELQTGTVLQDADVLRALLAGVSALEQMAARAQRRAQLPDNVGRAWSPDEECALVGGFQAGEQVTTLAAQHGRTVRAIEARLEKLGLLSPDQRVTQGGFSHRPATRASTPGPT